MCKRGDAFSLAVLIGRGLDFVSFRSLLFFLCSVFRVRRTTCTFLETHLLMGLFLLIVRINKVRPENLFKYTKCDCL